MPMPVPVMVEMLVTVEAQRLEQEDKVPTWHLATDKDMLVVASMRHLTMEVLHKVVGMELVLVKAWITFR
jgi:hypothetical protein